MSTRGAHSWVRMTPTGLPDWTSIVSSSRRSVRVRTIASKAGQLRAARPVPPYTTRSSGRSATSGSRLFISIRSGASVCQERAVSEVPRGARTGRAPSMGSFLSWDAGRGERWLPPAGMERVRSGLLREVRDRGQLVLIRGLLGDHDRVLVLRLGLVEHGQALRQRVGQRGEHVLGAGGARLLVEVPQQIAGVLGDQ